MKINIYVDLEPNVFRRPENIEKIPQYTCNNIRAVNVTDKPIVDKCIDEMFRDSNKYISQEYSKNNTNNSTSELSNVEAVLDTDNKEIIHKFSSFFMVDQNN